MALFLVALVLQYEECVWSAQFLPKACLRGLFFFSPLSLKLCLSPLMASEPAPMQTMWLTLTSLSCPSTTPACFQALDVPHTSRE